MLASLVAGLVFVGTLMTLGLLVWRDQIRHREARQALSHRIGPGAALGRVQVTREVDALGRWLGPPGAYLHRLLLRAGSEHTVSAVVAASLVAAVLGMGALAAARLGVFVLPGGLAGLLPTLWLIHLAERRGRRLTEQLPDALDLIGRALRAGHAFSDALRLAGQELDAPLGTELAHVSEEHRLGVPVRESLEGLVDRVPRSFELRMFVSSVMLHRETGGNLIEILEQLAETVRERVVFEGKVLALTAEVRMSAILLEVLPFATAALLLAVEPTYLTPLFQPGLGRTMLIGAGLSMLAGILVMRRVARVEL